MGDLLPICSMPEYPADKDSLLRGIASLHSAVERAFMAVALLMQVGALRRAYAQCVGKPAHAAPLCSAAPFGDIACTGLLRVPAPVQSVTAPSRNLLPPFPGGGGGSGRGAATAPRPHACWHGTMAAAGRVAKQQHAMAALLSRSTPAGLAAMLAAA